MNNEKQEALAKFLQIPLDNVINEDPIYQAEGAEYVIYDDTEAEEKWEESLDNYIEECILPEIPERYQYYFDKEKWKVDARFDGRGQSLSPYDGQENEIRINNTDYYIYRTN